MEYISSIISIVISILTIVSIYFNIYPHSIKNKEKRYNIIKDILDNKTNANIGITGLKVYLNETLSDKEAEYILNSPNFYELTTLYKSTKGYILFNQEKNSFVFKKDEPKLWPVIFQYFILSIPLVFLANFTYYLDKKKFELLAIFLLISIPCLIGMIFSLMEINNRKNAIKIVKKFNRMKLVEI